MKGLDIPVGMFIRPDVRGIHNSAEVWGPVDPSKFYPARMSPELKRHPMAFLGFGQGPRNCIGMKFAYTEMKLALVKLLLKFEIHPSANTPKKLELRETLVATPKYGVPVLLKKREFSNSSQ